VNIQFLYYLFKNNLSFHKMAPAAKKELQRASSNASYSASESGSDYETPAVNAAAAGSGVEGSKEEAEAQKKKYYMYAGIGLVVLCLLYFFVIKPKMAAPIEETPEGGVSLCGKQVPMVAVIIGSLCSICCVGGCVYYACSSKTSTTTPKSGEEKATDPDTSGETTDA
jgi:hypothetical protein